MPDPAPAGNLYLLDAHGLIFQMYYGVKGGMTAPDGRPTNAVFGVTRALMDLYDRGADYLIATLDHAEPTFRNRIDANYKSHRESPPDDLLLQEPMIQQIMEAMHIPFLIVPGYEADDIMATVATEAAARGLDVYLCTADKDCRQLITEKIKVLNLRKLNSDGVLDAAGVVADWGVRPDQVVDFQALVGDPVDNIPGVPGVGPKTAAKWLQEFGSLDRIIANVDKLSGGPKLKQALQDAIASGNLEKSRKLVALDTHVPLKFDWENWRRKDWDGQRLLELFHEFGFRSFADRVRKTLTASGAKKNAAVLESIGEARPTKATTTATKPATRSASRANTPGGDPARSPSLFDQIMEEEPPATLAPLTDSWSYAGYELVDTPTRFAAFLTELNKQSRIVFDIETTSLDPLQAEIVGYAFCWEPGKAYYLPVRAPAEDAVLDPARTLDALRPVFENPAVSKVNQNIKYDLMVLAAHQVRLANVAGDPMLAHYLLHPGARSHGLDDLTDEFLHHRNISITELIGKGKNQTTMDQVRTEKVRDYACEDADAAWQLAAIFEPQLEPAGLRALYDELEVPLISVLAEMELTGIGLDVPFLNKLSGEMAAELARIEQEIYALAGHEFNIGSLKQLQTVLFTELQLPVQKRTGIKGEPSTDQESLERLAALGHELPRRLLAYRQISKLKNTYVDVLPTLVNPSTGRIHTSFNQTMAETGRLSSSEPNLQNIPARTEQGAQLRKAFIPRKGWKLLTADYSQIELRLLAHFCGDDTLRRAFADDVDVHAAVAAEIFKVPVAQVTKQQRGLAKTVNFGVLYGMSANGLSIRLSIPKSEAEQFIEQYFTRYPKVREYQDQLLARARQTGIVSTILGRKRKFDPTAIRPNTSYHGRNQAEREAINMEIQGSAADLMKRAMLGVQARLKKEKRAAKMLLSVHDELVFEVPPREVKPLAALVREEMIGAMQLDVPLKVDVAVGPNWLDVEDM
jgi:DNA polymerase-1